MGGCFGRCLTAASKQNADHRTNRVQPVPSARSRRPMLVAWDQLSLSRAERDLTPQRRRGGIRGFSDKRRSARPRNAPCVGRPRQMSNLLLLIIVLVLLFGWGGGMAMHVG